MSELDRNSMYNLEEKVIEVIAESLSVEKAKVTKQASFVEDLGADSLDQVELVMALEDRFDIEIPDEEAQKILTVQDALNYISEKTLEKSET